jgi:hypothetical protein
MNDTPKPPVALNHAREKTVRALSEHFAQDNIAVEELEARLDMCYRATALEELEALTADLPVLRPSAEAAAPAEETVPAVRPSIEASAVRDTQVVLAILGGNSRRGKWTPPRHLYTVATMGGLELDFREARFPPGETEVTVFALMGGTEIIVPPGLPVRSSVVAIMGGFDQADHEPDDLPDDAPRLKINGLVLMGGVEVTVRLPGESARDAKRRRREERKRLRRERRSGEGADRKRLGR